MRSITAFLCFLPAMLLGITFKDLDLTKDLYLHAGYKVDCLHYKNYVGFDVRPNRQGYIHFDIRKKIPLPDGVVDRFHAEDIFEHIEYSLLPAIIDEIYRVLKVGGRLRLSVPDYRCDILYNRTKKDSEGNLLFDPGGGGYLKDGKVLGEGHVWFPKYELVKDLLSKTDFYLRGEICFYHYYDEEGNPVTEEIDYEYGYVARTPDHLKSVMHPYRPLSIVVDCIKR